MKASRYVLAAVVLGVLALGWLLSSKEEAPEPEAPRVPARAEVQPEPPRPPAPATAPVAQVPPLLAAPPEIPGEEGVHGEFTTSTDLIKQKIFKQEPKLAQFDYFREHVVLDSASREDYRRLLADRELIEQTRRELSSPEGDGDSMESNVKRLLRIDYLREALSWKENPERGLLVSTAERIILEDSFGAGVPMADKRSLAATKMELFEILHGQEPERAQALVAAARGSRLEKLLEYIAARNQRRLDRERELSLQAQSQKP